MQKFIDWMDSRSRLVKILFCLPIIAILWGVYRILGAIAKKDWVRLVLAIVWVIFAGFVGWILDLIWMILFNRIFWFKD